MYPSTTARGRHPRRERAKPRAGAAAAIACAAALVLAGCGGGLTGEHVAATPAAETVTVTTTAEPETTTTTEHASTDDPSPTPTPTACSTATVPVATDAAGIAPPVPGVSWTVVQTGNLCGALGYAELATTGGTGSSPTQLLLYNEGEFLGTGIRCNALGQVTSSSEDSVTVQYRWPVGNDSNANMRGRASVTFKWNGASVDMLGDLPAEALPGC